MANGRLGSTLIPAYAAAEIYNNTSGNAASISIHGQVVSSTSNSLISVAATSTNYYSTIYTCAQVSATSVNPYTCLKNVVYCSTTTEDYVGYYAQQPGVCCLSPSFVNSSGTVFAPVCVPSLNLCCVGVSCNNFTFNNFSIQSTAVNPEILVTRNACNVVIGIADTDSSIRLYQCSALNTPCLRARHFAQVDATGCTTPSCIMTCRSCCAPQCCISLAAVDYYSSLQPIFAYSGGCLNYCNHAYATGITTTCTCITCVCGGASCCACPAFQLNASYTHCPGGPHWFTGCEVLGIVNYGSGYNFKAYDSSCGAECITYKLIRTFDCAAAACTAFFCYALCTPTTGCLYYQGVAKPIRWMGYNPADGFNYMMWYSGSSDDGIYKLTNLQKIKNITWGNCCSCCTQCCQSSLCEPLSQSTVFTKVATIPTVFSQQASPCLFCPSRLYHVETCKWILGVYNSGWTQFVSCNLIDWSAYSCTTCSSTGVSTCCFAQLTALGSLFVSNGSGITKCTNQYFTCISSSGTIEYGVCANQYTKTGVVVSSGDRLYMFNCGDAPIAVNVWGYEG